MKSIIIKIDGKEIKAQVREEDIRKLTEEKEEWPRNGVYYYYINTASVSSSGGTSISIKMWDEDNDFCTINAGIGNVYRTGEEAKAALRTQILIAAVAKRRKELNGDWKVDWKAYQDKHFIRHDGDALEVECRVFIHSGNVFGAYKNADAASTIIDEFRDKLIWYFEEYLPSIN